MVGYIYMFVLLAALVVAFVAQCILSPWRRTRIIFAAAAAPTALLVGAALIAAFSVGIDGGWFWAGLSLLFNVITFMFVGLVGAIIGSELASLTKWLLRDRRRG